MIYTFESLAGLAERFMRDKGLKPYFSEDVLQELSHIQSPARFTDDCVDLRSLQWCSIDNETSRDLDQLTYAEKDKDEKITLWVAIADVDALVSKGSPIDQHAQANTTSVYTPTKVFSMLPERLSTNLTSLNEGEDRVAIVIKSTFNRLGDKERASIFRAVIHNYAKLTYKEVGEWLQDYKNGLKKVVGNARLEHSLKSQHQLAQILKEKRITSGALKLEIVEVEPKFNGYDGFVLKIIEHNFAHQLIEECMIASNIEMACHLEKANIPSIRRVVRVPKRWNKIVEIASRLGGSLPVQPDPEALNNFLIKRQQADPLLFPDLSLTIIKLLGRGEYLVKEAHSKQVGHFGLALPRYTHATAPNRRYPDLITQRLFKAHLQGKKIPYTIKELKFLARHCTVQEDSASKVERQINKSAAAITLSSQIGAIFQGIVTGSGVKGTWVRIFQPPIEGKVNKGFEKLDVGDHVTVKLVSTNVQKGYIDFVLLAANSETH